jgi:hypothetical protein
MYKKKEFYFSSLLGGFFVLFPYKTREVSYHSFLVTPVSTIVPGLGLL